MNNFLVRHTGFGAGSIKALLCPCLFPHRAYKREWHSIHPFTGPLWNIEQHHFFGLDREKKRWQGAGSSTNRNSLISHAHCPKICHLLGMHANVLHFWDFVSATKLLGKQHPFSIKRRFSLISLQLMWLSVGYLYSIHSELFWAVVLHARETGQLVWENVSMHKSTQGFGGWVGGWKNKL